MAGSLSTQSILTAGRTAAWDSVRNTPDLRSFFTKFWTFDKDFNTQMDFEPSYADLPSLFMFPATATPTWYQAENQVIPYAIDVAFWTRDWNPTPPEQIWQELTVAFFNATNLNGGVPNEVTASYIKQATGHHPRTGPLSITRTFLTSGENKIKATRGSMQLILRYKFNPFVTGVS